MPVYNYPEKKTMLDFFVEFICVTGRSQAWIFWPESVPSQTCNQGGTNFNKHCWWKKSCTTWHGWSPANNGIFTISTGYLGISSSNSILPCLLSRDHSLYLEIADHCFHVAWGKVECQTIIHDKLTEELADKAEQRGELQKQLMDAPIRRRSWDGDKAVLNVAKVSNSFLSLLFLFLSLSLSLFM